MNYDKQFHGEVTMYCFGELIQRPASLAFK